MRPDHYDAQAWEIFLAKLATVRAQNLEGEDLRSALELSWAHLFDGVDEATANDIYAEVMAALMRDKIIPPDWSAVF
jgi:hypothetical protein